MEYEKEEQKEYQLICSYVKHEYFISTAYRKSSALSQPPMWYFETMVWEWDNKTKETREWLNQVMSGVTEEQALESHFGIIGKLLKIKELEE